MKIMSGAKQMRVVIMIAARCVVLLISNMDTFADNRLSVLLLSFFKVSQLLFSIPNGWIDSRIVID